MANKSEKQIERECRRWAEHMGWMTLKMTCPGNAGVPDRMFMSNIGDVAFVEFKTMAGRLSPIQETMIKKFARHGHEVHVIRSLEQFKDEVMP